MIELKNATKYYKTKGENKYILKNVTLTIPSGKNIGILGRNGMGKSTLLKMLAGIDFTTSGSISSSNSFSWVMGLSKGLQPAMNGRQNVKFVCRIYGKSDEEIREISSYVKEFSELGDYFEMPIKSYSNGMKSRLSFGLSMAFDFDYIIIDEILSVGDASFKQKSQKALQEKMQTSHILMVSHSMETLKELCDAGLVVHNGELFYYDAIEDAIKCYFNFNNDFEPDQNTIYSSDGKTFKNIKNMALYYNVSVKSIHMALAKNHGSHLLLKVTFAQGTNEIPPLTANPKFKLISSNGILYKNEKHLFQSLSKKDKSLNEEDIMNVLRQEKKIFPQFNLELFYTSELLQ